MKALLALLAFCSLAAAAQHLAVELNYSNGTLSCVSAQLASGYPEDYRLHSESGAYSYSLLAANGSALDSFAFDAPRVFYDDFSANSTGGSSAVLDGSFELRAKTMDGAATVKITEGNGTVCVISLAAQLPAIPSPSPAASPLPSPFESEPPASPDYFWLVIFFAALATGVALYLLGKRE